MAKTQKVFTSRANNLTADNYVGEVGRLFYDEPDEPGVAPILRYSDGQTVGGIPIGSGGSGGGPRGYTGSLGFVGSQGIQGIIGYAGSRGLVGYVGSQGTQGNPGSTGYTGSVGLQGTQGNQGYTGSIGGLGYTGSEGVGYTGSQGTQGSTGYIGSQGTSGSLGYTGSQGTDGTTGFVGSQGTTGYIGSQGSLGFTGSAGTNGTNGTNGYIGSQGTTGYIGSAGNDSTVPGYTGSQGNDGYGYTGSAGADSTVPGYVGSQGNDGIGYVGSQGDIGYIGSAGNDSTVPGYVGSQGDLGYTGSAGNDSNVPGYTGSQGNDGIGYVGSQGDIGYIGSQGDIGYVGSQGDIGYVGSQGNDGIGYVGSQGDIGYIGSQGDIGYVGSQGNDGVGYTGSQGDIGYIGSAGLDGYQQAPWQLTSGTSAVILSADGTLTLPSSTNILYTTTNALIKSINNIQISAGDDVGSSWIFQGDGSLIAPGVVFANAVNVNSVVIPSNGVADGIVTSNGLGNIYFDTDNSLIFIITGTNQTSFNADGTTTFAGGYIFPNTQGTSGQVLVVSNDNPQYLEWQNQTGGGTGYTGSQGNDGIGYTGSAGNDSTVPGYVGSQGDIGYTGSQGNDGIGYVGSQGDIGYTGSAGNDSTVPGYTGSQGDIGYVGSKGSGITVSETQPMDPQEGDLWYSDIDGRMYVYYGSSWVDSNPSTPGFTGSTGAGYTGSQGNDSTVPGYTGSAGNDSTVPGYTGSQGNDSTVPGYTGSQGNDGVGYTGSAGNDSTVPGYTGSAGNDGIGYVGSQGNDGIGYTGSAGNDSTVPGYTGSQGNDSTIPGYTGSAGNDGIGYVGSQGDLGYVGSAGNDSTVPGYTGSAGNDGIGYVGSQGDIGYVGSQGNDGVGYTGSAGNDSTVPGYTGSAGNDSTVPGYIGSQGDIGYTGSQGDLGYTGSAGADSTVPGYTGSQGDLGYVGSAGYQQQPWQLTSSTYSATLSGVDGSLSVDSLTVPVGSIVNASTATVYTLASLTLTNVVAYSQTSTDALVIGDYWLSYNGIPAPYAVYEFASIPNPPLQVGDVIAGPGIPLLPVPTTVLSVGTGTYTNYVIGLSDYSVYGKNISLPQSGITIAVGRETVNANLKISTNLNTDILLGTGVGGNVIVNKDILPLTENNQNLGSPLRRWKDLYLGAGTVFLLDETLGTDITMTARDGSFKILGEAGLSVGNFEFFNNTLKLTDLTADFVVGSTTATGYMVVNRPFRVSSQVGGEAFNVDRNGLTTIYSPNEILTYQSALNIVGSSSGLQQSRNYNGTMLQITGQDNTSTRVSIDSFGTGNYPSIAGRQAGGSVTTATNTVAGDTLLRLTGSGYGDTGYVSSISRIDFQAVENFTDYTAGTRIRFQTTPPGSLSLQTVSADITATGLSLVGNPIGGITFRDHTFQITAWTTSTDVYWNQIQGAPSVTGYTGSAGTNGYTGSAGNDGGLGYTGSQGDVGYVGSQGTTGYIGSQGLQGPAGTSVTIKGSIDTASTATLQAIDPTPSIGDGYIAQDTGHLWVYTATGPDYGFDDVGLVRGPQGNDGSIGYVGSQGDVGYIGSQGTQGSTGYTGSQGTQGSTGYVGSQGTTGYVGSQGAQGTQGNIGYAGSIGLRGFTGSVGGQGVIGYTGSQGIQGITGLNGYNGSQGYTGSIGLNGYNGSQGIQGITGLNGYNGSQGTTGYIGSQGYTGSVGYTGSASTVAGPTGYVGSVGTIGYTGSVGAYGVDTGIDNSQYYVTTSTKTISSISANAITTLFGVGVAVNTGTRYQFQLAFEATNGPNNDQLLFNITGTSVLSRVTVYSYSTIGGAHQYPIYGSATSSFTTGINLNGGNNSNNGNAYVTIIQGFIDVISGGKANPSVGFVSAATNVVIQPNAYMKIWPISTNTLTNTVIGTWS